jgi:hypothetical protein
MSKPSEDAVPPSPEPWPREPDERSTSKAAHGDKLARAVGKSKAPRAGADSGRSSSTSSNPQVDAPQDDNLGT